ncbi:UNVERIFIED_CONTAM: hypothetical protein GTU68_007827 [Idotea baltica]|nr:hypothetical protein [Idotea baltica]
MTDEELFAASYDVSRETMERLRIYERLLKKWTNAINLVSKSTVPQIWRRHFLDSAQVFSEIPSGSKSLCDFGSGGGFPGLVISALAAEKNPKLLVSLIESDVRKASFLMTAAREMGLNVVVNADRVENIPARGADVITARALAPLANLLEMAELHMRVGGTALFLKGARYKVELDSALQMWNFQVSEQESATSEESALLTITDLRRAT